MDDYDVQVEECYRTPLVRIGPEATDLTNLAARRMALVDVV